VSDIVERLRAMAGPHQPNVCTEAADEIERLRLTDAEREVIEWCIFQQSVPQRKAVALRALLNRIG
jgi:hypothetical protein